MTTIARYSRTYIRPDLGVETAETHGWDIADYFDAGNSNGPNRLAFTRLLDDLAAGRVIGVIATDPLDLIGRYVSNAERFIDVIEHTDPMPMVIFENSDVDFHIPSGRFMVRMLVAMGEYERDHENRVRAARRAYIARNRNAAGGAL